MATLTPVPPLDPTKSAIENDLELTQLLDISPDLFTNTRPLWHPPGARGLYGGCVIAQSVAAAQRTVPDHFSIHSMHCYFVLAGDSAIPIVYAVEHVREGRSFATRTVQARQRGKVIFTTTMSFVREGAGGKERVRHSVPFPADVPPPREDEVQVKLLKGFERPFQVQRVGILNNNSPNIHTKRTRSWFRARGRISDAGGHQAHLSALAYMTDNYFIGTVARVHQLWRWSEQPTNRKSTADEDAWKQLLALDDETLKRLPEMDEDLIERLRTGRTPDVVKQPEVGMMVSLDHSIYFHHPREFRADEWMLTEMESPWADDGRGMVVQRIYSRDGRLIASCFQEGVIRLKQPSPSKL